jgi:addiction module HigA family antidote
MADLLRVGGRRRNQRRDRRLPLIVEETMSKLKNVHPGEVLLEVFLVPMNLCQNAVARAVCVPPRRINEIVLGKRAITADTVLRLLLYFGTSEQFWMGLQADYDLKEARKGLGRQIDAIEWAAA